VSSRKLPPLLRSGVELVLVGTEPGPTSLKIGRYYANPNNSFYADLARTGLTPRQLTPQACRELLGYGIGLDDVYDDPRALWRRLARVAPLAVCFNSKQALERFAGAKIGRRGWRGAAAREIVEIAEVTRALDDSSPAARAYHSSRVDGLEALRAALERARTEAPRHRCNLKLEADDLRHLLALESTWRRNLESQHDHWRLYRDHLVCICLAQGAAKHMIDGTTGIKDFDVYRIFTASERRPQPDPAIYRGRTVKDFGESRFGRRTDWWGRRRFGRFAGRNVDIFSATLPDSGDDPVEAIQRWLSLARTGTERSLAEKAVVLIDGASPRVAWPRRAVGAALRGFSSSVE
jgi:G:T/U-mismatch repair DNA glycosylase